MTHPGEAEAQLRFGVPGRWNEEKLERFYNRTIDDETALWLENLPFCFIATSDQNGNCDCSFRGRETGPLLKVENPKSILMPDYSGNRLYNSLGNMLVNPHVGMLFIDFFLQHRLRINGRTEIIELDEAARTLWPGAERAVRISIDQCYGNCRKRIPRMNLVIPPPEWEEGDSV